MVMAPTEVMSSSDAQAKIPRPQVGIDRLPDRRQGHEPKEVMNCKSCRKRKIKCSRARPSCEACQIFDSECVYDSVPKKRGPKTDVLEALVKRINGLEERLQDERRSEPASGSDVATSTSMPKPQGQAEDGQGENSTVRPPADRRPSEVHDGQNQPVSSTTMRAREPIAFTDALLDTFFSQIHEKPYYILDETATRQRLRDGHLPQFLINAIHAVSIKYVPHLCGGPSGAMRTSQRYAVQSRNEIDCDEPTIDNLQALLLLAVANLQCGKGKKSYMLLSHAVTIAFALSLHRELPQQLQIAPSEREGRRKLFWTCYLMDRFTVCGSRRPPLISDESICLRYPAWRSSTPQTVVDGNYFPNSPSTYNTASGSNAGQGGGAILVESVRILGIAHRYIAAGGVKSDSHFPWHSQSILSRIRSDLDHWAMDTHDSFESLSLIFGLPDSTMLILSKLIYHLIHCLIYRPFLPVDLAELSGQDENQSWQYEAFNLCFIHANAIIELVELGREARILHWPSFVGYCIFTAGTIHIHGAHYMSFQERDVFARSGDLLLRGLEQLSRLRSTWATVQHEWETLQTLYAGHSRLVQSFASNPWHFSPVFQTEDFFDRWTDCYIDSAHVTFTVVSLERLYDGIPTYPELNIPHSHNIPMDQAQPHANSSHRPSLPSQSTPREEPSAQRTPKRRRLTTGCSEAQPSPIQQPILATNPEQLLSKKQSLDSHRGDSSHRDHVQEQSVTQAPILAFSPMPTIGAPHNAFDDPFCGAQAASNQPTPSRVGASIDRPPPAENDPFLSFLEELAEGSTQDLGFYLGEYDEEGTSAPSA